MKFNIYIAVLCAAGLLFESCKKDLAVEKVDFSVTSTKTDGTPSAEFKVGDTINYVFSGNPDAITMYTGMLGSRYEYRTRTEAEGQAVLSFKTTLTNPAAQANSLTIFFSSDFEGAKSRVLNGGVVRDTVGTNDRIQKATWVPITNRAVLATSTTAVSSGNIDLSDIAANNKPIYIAFRYVAGAITPKPLWKITEFLVKNKLPDNTEYTIANMLGNTTPYQNYGADTYSPGFTSATDTLYKTAVRWSTTTAAVETPNSSSAIATESWAIIGPINLKAVTPDKGLVIKAIENRIKNYLIPRAYTVAGDYKVSFLGTNTSGTSSNEAVKELTIKVRP